MRVYSKKEAWEMADNMFATDYEKDDASSEITGYPIYRSRIEESWICDLGNRLEVNLADGTTTNIWIEKINEYQIEEALKVMDDAIYKIEDNITWKVREALGIEEVTKILYGAFAKAKELLSPESKLIEKYSL